ncbi:hypothetical protein LguiB_005372 [Lonicera macranthoides]
MSIIIFSKDYASSSACLYEVETILEHSKHSKHTILPVFYHVEPAELKQKARDLAPVLAKEYQKGWSKALEEVVSIAGMPLKDQYESDFITQIVEVVESKLSLKALPMDRHLIGMDSRVEGVNLWLEDKSTKNMLMMICGMGGLGKTTIAKSKSRRNSCDEVLETRSFEKMCNLRLLKITRIQLSGTYDVLPKKIRWLSWRDFHLNSLPDGFPLENLVVLDMRNNSLKRFWKATEVLESLKVLNLNHSTELLKTPDFSSTPNLEKLILKDCPRLVENLGSTLPVLKHLYLGGNPIGKLPECVRNLGGLEKLDLSWCPKLQQIIWPSVNLQELIVTECRSLKQITYETSARVKSISHGACMSLDYVEEGFKIEAVAKVDREVLRNFGFSDLVSMETVEVMIANRIVWSKKKCPLQILYECGVFSTYFPGREVPHWFNLKITGSTISFAVPSHPSLKLRGLNLCLLYTMSETEWLPTPISVQIKNTSNNAKIKYEPRCYGISEVNGDVVWLSHWPSKLWENCFKEAHQVEVSFYMNLVSTSTKVEGQIKECGVQFLYFEEDEGLAKYFNTLYSSWDSGMDIFHHLNRQSWCNDLNATPPWECEVIIANSHHLASSLNALFVFGRRETNKVANDLAHLRLGLRNVLPVCHSSFGP